MSDLTFKNPLTEEDLQKINDGIEGAKLARVHIAMAKKAGIDVASQETAVQDMEAKLQRIKSTYFPNR